MTENEKLRALLAEARRIVNECGGCIDCGIGSQEVWPRINAALAEPVDLSYTQDDVNRMTGEMIALRKDYEKIAFQRGAEAMREAAMGAAWHHGAMYLHKQIKELPTPEDKP